MTPTPHRGSPQQSGPLSDLSDDQTFKLSVASVRGLGREINQDSYACLNGRAYVIADGVGGGSHGEIASAYLCNHLVELVDADEHTVNRSFSNADRLIADKLKQLGSGAGAAVAVGLWSCASSSDEWLASWVGDCRILHQSFEAGRWNTQWISTDQTYANLNLPAPLGVDLDSPANMVGCGMSFSASHHRLNWALGDRFILASDGFWRSVDASDLVEPVEARLNSFSTGMAHTLCELAQSRGSQDDITVMVIERHSI